MINAIRSGMSREHLQHLSRPASVSLRLAVLALAVFCGLEMTACRSRLNDSALALDAATAPVVDQAAAAYRAANAIHDLRVDYDAAAQFDLKDPVYNPRQLQVLLSDQDLEARLAVLKGFQVYVKNLCAVTSGTDPKELGNASANVGGELSSLANTLAASFGGGQAGQSTDAAGSATSATPVVGTTAQNGISTALYALGKFLVSRKVKNELPAKIIEMDPHVQKLAGLLESDIGILRD